jgi:glycosyltransferase involved in cell wall biosynthesis
VRPKQERIRILRVIARMNVGGPALQIYGLSTHLNKQRFDQLLITGFCDEDEFDFLTAHKIPVPAIKIPGLGRNIGLLSDLIALFQVWRVMRQFRPHVVHTHTAKAGVLGRIASILSFQGHKRVHTFHGHLLFGYFSKIGTRIVILIERLLAKQTQILISVGSQVKDDLLLAKIGTVDKFRIVPPGLELNLLKSKNQARIELGLDQNAIYFSWIGRVVSIKNPLRLVRIAEIAKSSKLPIRFCVAGDGPLFPDFSQLARDLNLPIDFLGWQPEIERVLSASDAVILTSINEGTPLSLIQAQMAGKPVISTAVGSVPEIVENNKTGFVGDFSDEEFASYVIKLSKDAELRASMGSFGREYALKRFSVERLVNDHEDIYTELIQ